MSAVEKIRALLNLPLAEQVRGAIGVIAFALGRDRADAPLRDVRRVVCAHCPQLDSSPPAPSCGVCGCFVKAKTALASQQCPLGKWPGEDLVTDEDARERYGERYKAVH